MKPLTCSLCTRAVLASLVACGANVFATPTVSNGSTDQLLGPWNGRSLCVTQRPACTDETVLYRISRNAPAGLGFQIEMNKIVTGEVQWMVSLNCRFDEVRQQLVCPVTGGQWQFRWDGSMLLGGLIDEGNVALVRFATVRKGN